MRGNVHENSKWKARSRAASVVFSSGRSHQRGRPDFFVCPDRAATHAGTNGLGSRSEPYPTCPMIVVAAAVGIKDGVPPPFLLTKQKLYVADRPAAAGKVVPFTAAWAVAARMLPLPHRRDFQVALGGTHPLGGASSPPKGSLSPHTQQVHMMARVRRQPQGRRGPTIFPGGADAVHHRSTNGRQKKS